MEQPNRHAWGTQPEMFGPRHEHRIGMFVREAAMLRPGSRILDGAAGLGQLALRLRERGYSVVAVDFSFDAALHASRNASVPAVAGDMTRLPFRQESFDAVTSGETFEHLPDDGAAAREVARVLRTGGRAIVTVPALQRLWTAIDDYYQHERRYSREQLSRIFANAGLEIEKASFWGFPAVLFYDLLFLLPMHVRRARADLNRDLALQSVARAGRSRMLVRAVRALFAIDRLFSWIPFGPGLLLVCRKNRAL